MLSAHLIDQWITIVTVSAGALAASGGALVAALFGC
jgi:ClpP class serine protease